MVKKSKIPSLHGNAKRALSERASFKNNVYFHGANHVDGMKISSFANGFKKPKYREQAHEIALKGPSIDHAKINRIKKQLSNGDYIVSPPRIALYLISDNIKIV